VVLNKLLGGDREPFLVLSEETSSDVVIAPTRPDEPEAEEVSQSSEKPIVLAQAVPKPVAAVSKAQPAVTKQKPAKALTTAELLAAERASEQKEAPVRSTVTFAAELLTPSKALPRRRRRPGAALAGFKAMVGNLQR
jgi:hypothetical protein